MNAAPVAANRAASTSEDKPVAIVLSASDANDDPLSYSIVSGPSNGTLTGSGANLSYTPKANYHGSDSFTYRASDGSASSNIASVSITVTPVNDAPVASSNSLETPANQALAITLSASDKDGDKLSYRIVSEPAQGTLGGSGTTLTYTPNAGASGRDSFTYVANDGEADSNNGVVQIRITAAKAPKSENQAPAFAAKLLKFSARQRMNFSEQLEAVDPDAGDVVKYRKLSGPEWLNVAENGQLGGTPPAGTKDAVRCRVLASDKAGASAEAVVEIKIGAAPLPLPWSLARIGPVRPASTAFSKSGALSLKATGMMTSRRDYGIFAWQTLSDRGEIIARISAMANVAPDAKVGLMMRRSLATNSKFAFLGVDGRGRIHWAQRAMTAGNAKEATRSGGKLPDVWLRLTRRAGKISAYTSRNGKDWTFIGSVWRRDVALNPTCYIGLWASSGSDDLCSAVFRNVEVTP